MSNFLKKNYLLFCVHFLVLKGNSDTGLPDRLEVVSKDALFLNFVSLHYFNTSATIFHLNMVGIILTMFLQILNSSLQIT